MLCEESEEGSSAGEDEPEQATGTLVIAPQKGAQLSKAKDQRSGRSANKHVQSAGAILEPASEEEAAEEDEEVPERSAKGMGAQLSTATHQRSSRSAKGQVHSAGDVMELASEDEEEVNEEAPERSSRGLGGQASKAGQLSDAKSQRSGHGAKAQAQAQAQAAGAHLQPASEEEEEGGEEAPEKSAKGQAAWIGGQPPKPGQLTKAKGQRSGHGARGQAQPAGALQPVSEDEEQEGEEAPERSTKGQHAARIGGQLSTAKSQSSGRSAKGQVQPAGAALQAVSEDEGEEGEEEAPERSTKGMGGQRSQDGQLSKAKDQRSGRSAKGQAQTTGAILQPASEDEDEDEEMEEVPERGAKGPAAAASRAVPEPRAAASAAPGKPAKGADATAAAAASAGKRKQAQQGAKRQRAGAAPGGGAADLARSPAATAAGADAEPSKKRYRVSAKSADRISSADARHAELSGSAESRPGAKPASDLRLVTTGLHLSDGRKRTIVDLGVKVLDAWSSAATHLVADTFRRTTKLMCAICTGASIVTPEFIDACGRAGGRVDEGPFILRDRVCEAGFARRRGIQEYSLEAAVERARRNGPLLRGMSVYCFPSVTDRRELPALVAAAGGKWLAELPASASSGKTLLLAERAASGKEEKRRRREQEVYDVELLREAACTQELRRQVYRLR